MSICGHQSVSRLRPFQVPREDFCFNGNQKITISSKTARYLFILGKYAVVLSTIMILVNGVSCMAPQSPKHTVAYAKVVLISYPTGSLLKHWLSLRIDAEVFEGSSGEDETSGGIFPRLRMRQG